MEILDELIKVAIMGTGSQTLSDDLPLPKPIQPLADAIQQKGTDKEDKFLGLSSLLVNYYKAGRELPGVDDIENKPAQEETKKTCSPEFSKLLKIILQKKINPLLNLWLEKCSSSNSIVEAEYIPELLEYSKKYSFMHKVLRNVIGNRGLWLASLNDSWSYVFAVMDESLWETGKLEEREKLLFFLRETDPQKARELVEQTWKEEDLNTKLTFLSCFQQNLSLDDETFLEKRLDEKSNKVWEIAFDLLKSLPNSKLVENSWKILSSFIQLDKKKSIVPSGKVRIQFNLPDSIDEEIKNLNFRLGNRRDYTKEENFLFELISITPPKNWEEEYDISKEKVLTEFNKRNTNKKYLDAFLEATILHRDLEWTKYLLENTKIFQLSNYYLIKLLNIIPHSERERYILKALHSEKIGTYDDWFLNILNDYSYPWTLEFSLEMFYLLGKLRKSTDKGWFQEFSIYMHKGIIEECKTQKFYKKLPKQEQNSIKKDFFDDLGYEISSIIQLREEIQDSKELLLN